MSQILSLPYSPDPEPLFLAVRDLPGVIWFDSGKPGSDYGRYDIISALPSATLCSEHNHCTLLEDGKSSNIEGPPFEQAEQLLARLPELPASVREFPFVGGLAGFFSYGLGKQLEHTPHQNPPVDALPEMRLGLYHWSLVIDHQKQSTQLVFLDSCTPETFDLIRTRLTQPDTCLPISTFALSGEFQASMTPSTYRDAIARIHDYIQAGDCYQVNFAQHFSAPYRGDVLAAYLLLRRALPSPFSAFMSWNDQAILSLSPERFLEVSTSGQVETKPIKGTIRRGRDYDSDRANASQLLASTKDRAENLMIVDLLRNDLGKSCRPGSIAVPSLFALESFANVHHLVSTVTGELEQSKSSLNLLKGCFPGGSITGAPKRRAMEIIEELEQCQRSVYCGSIGYISRCGRMDTNIAIRTLVADAGQLHCWGGGGIVADSDPDAEYQESLDKVQVLMQNLEQYHHATGSEPAD